MYLYSRRARSIGPKGMEVGMSMVNRFNEVTGNDSQLWANTLSPGYGTFIHSSWWTDPASFDAAAAQLGRDSKYYSLLGETRTFVDIGRIDEGLYQTVSGEPDASAPSQSRYGSSVQAVCAAGNIVLAMATGIELAHRPLPLKPGHPPLPA